MTLTKKSIAKNSLTLRTTKKKSLERAEIDAETAIAKAKESIETLADEIKALEKGIKELDKSVVEATEDRQEANQEFKTLMAQDTKAKEILKFAKKRLNKFYNPTLALAQKAKLESPLFAEVAAHAHSEASPGPPPDTWDAY